MLKILGRATSSNVQKVVWLCKELDIPYDRTDIGGPFGGNRRRGGFLSGFLFRGIVLCDGLLEELEGVH